MSCWELAEVMYQVTRQALSTGKSSRTTQRRRKLVRIHDVVVLFLLIRNNLELWTIFHDELDLDGNGHLDSEELALALGKAGELTQHMHYLLPNNLRRYNTNASDIGGIHDNLDI
jgi:hypothetical protein